MEIQLGHMCNNRCVFCVSGQRTEQREAFPLEADPILEKIREGHALGMRKLTILGGEPTIQPEFMTVVREAVRLGFDEIVIFTNGAKTARASFVDEILATGGNFTFRFSFQGGNMLAHERTTKKLGSFGRLVESMKNVKERGRRRTVNMCVVRSNFESVSDFPKLLLAHGADQLHLDMVRPLDAGVRTDEEMRDMLPRYSDMVPALERMIAGFPEGFDVNIGNLPYCVAPQLARYIHHDGEKTMTIAVDDRDSLSEAWDKYEVKRRDKLKLETCRSCVFDEQCSGVFETYQRFYGLAELVPVTAERLVALDPEGHLFTMHLRPALARLATFTPPAPFSAPTVALDSIAHEARLVFGSQGGPAGAGGDVVVALRRPGSDGGAGSIAATELFSMHLIEAGDVGPEVVALLRAALARLCEGGSPRVIHPVAEDAGFLSAAPRRSGGSSQSTASLDPRLALRLKRLRDRAPFGELSWRHLEISAGRDARLTLSDASGGTAFVTLSVRGAQVTGGYKLGPGSSATPQLVDGLRALMGALNTAA